MRAMEPELNNTNPDNRRHAAGQQKLPLAKEEINLSKESFSSEQSPQSEIAAGYIRKAGHERVLFRGSFNPVHGGHLSVVKEMLHRGYRTIIMDPVSTSPGKGTIPTPKEVRAEMIIAALTAEGIPVAKTPDAPGVYVCTTRDESRRELRRALTSRTDFAMGEDNDTTYSEHTRWKIAKKLGEDRLAIVKNESTIHSSDIRKGEAPPHPATEALIEKYSLYRSQNTTGLKRYNEVLVLYNPISGAGQGAKMAETFAAEFGKNGVNVTVRASSARYQPGELEQELAGKDLALVIGGDGTIMGTLSGLAYSKTPVYMVPAGNESLFSKLFEMSKDTGAVLDRLQTGNPVEHYHGTAIDRPFFLMFSVGFDAAVLETIGERSGPSSNLMYLKAGMKALFNYHTPEITLKVDGKEVISGEKGYLIIANTSSYGRNLNLVPEASSKENELQARFFPQTGILPELEKGMRMAFRIPANLNGSRLYTGSEFELSVSNKPCAAQADGEYVGKIGVEPVKISVSNNPIRVIE